MKCRSFVTVAGSAALLLMASASLPPTASAAPASTDYLVLFASTSNDGAARKAIKKAGGTVTELNSKLGYAYVRSNEVSFAAKVDDSAAVIGAARERVIGSDQKARGRDRKDVEQLTAERRLAKKSGSSVAAPPAAPAAEPLANRQWDMRQIGATSTGSYASSPGKKGVRVGIIDTGIDGTHPDIAPNFDAERSVNFVTDIPAIDGPCEVASCKDPANVDDDGHGTHVASTIGSPLNGIGIGGVAPNVSLVNIRAGQDAGYFFLEPTLKALVYAGDIGVDVINMSFYVDPWLYNCTNNPADSAAEQAEQRVIRITVQRALTYAVNHGVLPVAAMGNEATDLGKPTSDNTSPDYPDGAAKDRTVDNSCINVPTESRGVVAVSSTGPSKRKAYYSNFGTEQTDIAAPGGDFYDSTTNTGSPLNLVLAAYPKHLAEANGELNPDGSPKTDFVVRDCTGGTCSYYQYLQGTSMASPHAAGVAALVVSKHGKKDAKNGGLTLPARQTMKWLYKSAQPQACPQPRNFHYTRITGTGAVIESDAFCAGNTQKNGFYGRGIVNAYAAGGNAKH